MRRSTLSPEQISGMYDGLEPVFQALVLLEPADPELHKVARRLRALHELRETGGITPMRFDRLTADDREWLGLEAAT